MWFINDVTIKKLGHSETKVLQVCSEKNIKVGNAWHKAKWLGRIISDKDYQILMSALAKERQQSNIQNWLQHTQFQKNKNQQKLFSKVKENYLKSKKQ